MNSKLITVLFFALALSSCGISNKLSSIKSGDIARFSFSDLKPSSIPIVKSDETKWISRESRDDQTLAWAGAPDSTLDIDLPTELPLQAEDGLLPPKPQ
jgi:hypothetical protein